MPASLVVITTDRLSVFESAGVARLSLLSKTGIAIRPVATGAGGTISANAVGATDVGFNGFTPRNCRFSRSNQAPTARITRTLANVSQRIMCVAEGTDASGGGRGTEGAGVTTRARLRVGTRARLVGSRATTGGLRYSIAAAIMPVSFTCSASSIKVRMASGEMVSLILAASRMRMAPLASANAWVHTNTRSPLRRSSCNTITCSCSPCSYIASLPLRMR